MWLAITIGATMVLGGCSGTHGSAPTSTATTSSTGSPSVATPVLTGNLSVTGQFVAAAAFAVPAAVEVNGLQTPMPPGTSCATYANGYSGQPGQNDGIGFDPPMAEAHGPPSVLVTVSLRSGYQGPGSYASGAPYTILGTATIGVQTAEGPSYYTFNSRGGATSFTVGAEGSGSLRFSGWRDTETRGGNGTGTLSGAMSWTCG